MPCIECYLTGWVPRILQDRYEVAIGKIAVLLRLVANDQCQQGNDDPCPYPKEKKSRPPPMVMNEPDHNRQKQATHAEAGGHQAHGPAHFAVEPVCHCCYRRQPTRGAEAYREDDTCAVEHDQGICNTEQDESQTTHQCAGEDQFPRTQSVNQEAHQRGEQSPFYATEGGG
ncbi:MAG: hypothetical protein DDT27_01062 [Dehalococcoidia bacterium]|nr:hypothetical protein [Chloroflexota bacterium]